MTDADPWTELREDDDRVRGVLVRASRLPSDRALRYLQEKGLAPTLEAQAREGERAFFMSKVVTASILKGIKGLLEKALAEGLTYDEWRAEAGTLLEQLGYDHPAQQRDPKTGQFLPNLDLTKGNRLETVFRWHMQEALMAGRMEAVREAGLPYLQFIAVRDNRTTPTCYALHGTIVSVEDKILSSITPPLHMNCRSRMDGLDEGQVLRSGITPISGDLIKFHLASHVGCSLGSGDGFDHRGNIVVA